jgi:hypothetical protein
MLTAKSVIATASRKRDEYLCLDIDNTPKMVEIEGSTERMTLFLRFSRNQDSLWSLMCRQAGEHFTFREEILPESVGQSTIERTYATPVDHRFGFILSNDLIDGQIHAQITIPVSERALDKFIEWDASPAGCCKFFAEELKLAMGEESQNYHYRPGALLGNYSD